MSDPMIPSDELKRALRNGDAFSALVRIWGLDEVRIALAALSSDLGRQLGEGTDPEWRRRAHFLRRVVDDRLREVKGQIKARNIAETATVDAINGRWGDFAQDLAETLERLDPQILLGIAGPGDGLISAAEWLSARRDWQARKASAREAVIS